MSEPTYRIDLRWDTTLQSWQAQGFRLSDGQYVSGSTALDPVQWLAAQKSAKQMVEMDRNPGTTLYASEDGEIVPAPEPQSLRA